MRSPAEILEKRVRESMARVCDVDNPVAAVRPAQDERFGHFQANGVMGLAKKCKRKGPELAREIVKQTDLSDICSSVEVAGPGFINMRLSHRFLGRCTAELGADPNLGIEQPRTPETVVVDFSSPNVAKEMHVGHIRSTIIGDSISRILEAFGYNVRRVNHVGDWGTQFGMLIQYLKAQAPESISGEKELSIQNLEEFYRQAKAACDSDPAFAESSREEVVRLQRGDQYSLKAWRAICEASRKKFQHNYDVLDVRLEEMGESFYNPFLPEVAQDLKRRNIACESEGATCVFIPGFNAPFMIRKRDGGFGYAATDLAALRYRVRQMGAKRVIYVTDSRQKEHFQLLFATARKAGYAGDEVMLDHAAFGSVLSKDGKPLKTREGRNVLLRELIQEAFVRAERVVSEKNPNLSKEQREKIAWIVGIGALKYGDLRQNLTSDYVFDWNRMLDLNGDTAPYLQYAYARIRSIFRKGGLKPEDFRSVEPEFENKAEEALAVYLLRYNEVVKEAASRCRPHFIANYLYELATRFTGFYTNCPVLQSGPRQRRGRLALCEVTSRVLEHGLSLLGIKVNERM